MAATPADRARRPRHAFREPGTAERPDSPPPSYGVPTEGGDMMAWSFVLDRLARARNYWISTVRPDGRPHAAPIWGVFVEDDLYLETNPSTRKARNLAADPRVSVHPELADEVVIVEGTAEPFRPDMGTAADLALAFASKYPGYRPEPGSWEGGGLYLVTPSVVLAWRDMPTATRWRLPAVPATA